MAHTRFQQSWIVILLSIASTLASGAEKTYRPARLPNGQPDLQGMWVLTNNTPLTRLADVATLVISKEQAAEYDHRLHTMLSDPRLPGEPYGHHPAQFTQPIRGQYRSSVIVDPPTGIIPGTSLFNEWQAKVGFNTLNAMDGPEQRPNSERCLGNPNPQPPHVSLASYLHQIVQTQDAFLFVSELLHSARIVRYDTTHVPAAVTSWLGDSIAKWEDDTLVITTTRFTSSDTGRIGPRISFRVSPNTIVIERFRRVSERQLDYTFTVTDPLFYTQPWTGETQFTRSEEHMFEDSCHEGNRSLGYVLQGARVKEGTWPGSRR